MTTQQLVDTSNAQLATLKIAGRGGLGPGGGAREEHAHDGRDRE
jgi:hypothetical protein